MTCSRSSKGLNADPAVDGILVQLPLAEAHLRLKVIEAIDPAKDARLPRRQRRAPRDGAGELVPARRWDR